MPIPLQALAASLTVVAGLMTLLWVVSLRLRNVSIVDIFWGPGFVAAAGVAAVAVRGPLGARAWMTLALVTVWAARLAAHIFLRNRGKGEDFRYRAWRERIGGRFAWVSLAQVFLLQAFLIWLISHPIQSIVADRTGRPLGILDGGAVLLWLIGFAFETVSDIQLARFKSGPSNRSRVLRSGLWAWTRHPNYFGDALQWWAFYLLALGVPGGWVTAYSPAWMTVLLLRISGVRLIEQSLIDTKPGYREYVRQVSAFLPLPPRRKKP
jgi:steroid 5-alpha reductase family enzyme